MNHKISLIFKKAPFPAIMTTISFATFIVIYWLVTARSINPHYFEGLLFAVPFICFGVITFFTVTGNLKVIASTLITSILICIFSYTTLYSLIFMVFNEATTVTKDISKYERVLKLTNYPNNSLTKYFPDKIPHNAKNIVFSYNPHFLQGGENFYLKFEMDSSSINNYINKFSQKSKLIGKSTDSEAEKNGVFLDTFNIFGYTTLPEDFIIYLIDSKPYHPNDWNHGKLTLTAISQQRNEIIFIAKDW